MTLAGQVTNLLEQRRLNLILSDEQRKLQELNEELTEQKTMLQAVFDQTSAGLVLYEAVWEDGLIVDFRFALTNQANAQTTHRSVAEMTGNNLLDLFPTTKEKGFYDQLVQVLTTGQPERFQQRYQGDSIDAYIDGTLLRLGERVLFTYADVTAMTRQNQALEQARQTAEEALELRDTFLANISHELRTPLTSILGFSELLAGQQPTETGESYVRHIQGAGQNLLRLINNLLDSVKLEYGQLVLEPVQTSLAEVMETVGSLVALQAGQKNLEFNLQVAPSLPVWVEADSVRLGQVLLNLCSNAVKFTERGQITLTVAAQRPSPSQLTVQFRVSDTGIGIPPDQQAQIFERFAQSSVTVSRRYGGTGLGLSIARGLVTQMGGTISLQSKPGQGTTVEVVLPFTVPMAAAGENEPETEAMPLLPPDLTVLVVDDNPFNQKLAHVFLSAYGLQPQMAGNGLEALAAIRAKVPDVILLDIQMPLMDGYQTARHIRNTLQLPVPIIAVTANTLTSERDSCLQAGMNDHLSKPYTKAQLGAKIGKWSAYRRNLAPLPTDQRFRSRIHAAHLRNSFASVYDLMGELLASFGEEWPEKLKFLSSLLESGEFAAFRSAGQSFRSSLYAMGMYQAAERLQQLEEQLEVLSSYDLDLRFNWFIDLVEESITGLGVILRDTQR